MPPFRSAPVAKPQPTIADRLGEAAALAGYATSLFRTAADNLEVSARQHEEIAAEAQAVIDDHNEIRISAVAAAAAAQKQADKIRDLIS
jgi:hypothetical protein